jgi:soluble lytic murein transglycosylase-like protein
MLVAAQAAAAEPAYKFQAPDGSVIFTDKPLAPPFKLVKRLKLTWGERRARIPKPRINIKAAPQNRRRFDGLIAETAEKHRLLPELLHAVIEAESAYDPSAVSHAGAVGLMQLMPATAKRFGVVDRTDPRQNLDGGATYLRFLLDYFSNDLTLALAGYNAGENAVEKYERRVPPYKETRGYVAKVLTFFRRNLAQLRGRRNLTAMVDGETAAKTQPTIR